MDEEDKNLPDIDIDIDRIGHDDDHHHGFDFDVDSGGERLNKEGGLPVVETSEQLTPAPPPEEEEDVYEHDALYEQPQQDAVMLPSSSVFYVQEEEEEDDDGLGEDDQEEDDGLEEEASVFEDSFVVDDQQYSCIDDTHLRNGTHRGGGTGHSQQKKSGINSAEESFGSDDVHAFMQLENQIHAAVTPSDRGELDYTGVHHQEEESYDEAYFHDNNSGDRQANHTDEEDTPPVSSLVQNLFYRQEEQSRRQQPPRANAPSSQPAKPVTPPKNTSRSAQKDTKTSQTSIDETDDDVRTDERRPRREEASHESDARVSKWCSNCEKLKKNYEKEITEIRAQLRRMQEEMEAHRKEKESFEQWKLQVKRETEQWVKEQKEAAQRERRVASRQAKAEVANALSEKNKKESEQLSSLRATLEKTKLESEATKKRLTSQIQTLKHSNQDLKSQVAHLEDQVKAYEYERVALWSGTNQSAPQVQRQQNVAEQDHSAPSACSHEEFEVSPRVDELGDVSDSGDGVMFTRWDYDVISSPPRENKEVRFHESAHETSGGVSDLNEEAPEKPQMSLSGGFVGAGVSFTQNDDRHAFHDNNERIVHSHNMQGTNTFWNREDSHSEAANGTEFRAKGSAATYVTVTEDCGSVSMTDVDAVANSALPRNVSAGTGNTETRQPLANSRTILISEDTWDLARTRSFIDPADEVDSMHTLSDNKVETRFKSGARSVRFRNATEKEVLADGRQLIRFFNGDIRKFYPKQGMEIYYFAEAGSIHTSYPNGTQVYQFKNGQIEHHHQDGRKEIKYPNGPTKLVFPNGEEHSYFTDGSVLYEYADGTKELISAGH